MSVRVSRRTLFALAPLFGSFVWLDAPTGLANFSTDSVLVQLGDLLAKSADALSKFGDSIAHLVTLGTQGYDAVAARQARNQLVEMRVNLEKLIHGINSPLIKSINDYVKHATNGSSDDQVLGEYWNGILDKVYVAITQVDDLLTDVNQTRNDFVLQDAYSTIQEVLHGRSSLLQYLRMLRPPVEQDELNELAKVGMEYQRLSDATEKASQQLATYIGSLK
jgi:hypothetical protein